MPPPKILREPDGTLLIERFSPIRRAEHIFSIVVFVLLILTGFPQKYYTSDWASWIIGALGGLDQARTIHRITGLVFVGHAVVHLSAIVVGIFAKKMSLSLLPTPQDLRDAWNNLRYYLGYRNKQPDLPKFDYRQKFEYVGLILGGFVMIATGLILLYPTVAVSILPGEFIPAARVAHSSEAVLALLVLVVWHVYGSHLSPEIFPMDKTIFTGHMPLEELEERHHLEYQRQFPNGLPKELLDEAPSHTDASSEPDDEPPDDESEACCVSCESNDEKSDATDDEKDHS